MGPATQATFGVAGRRRLIAAGDAAGEAASDAAGEAAGDSAGDSAGRSACQSAGQESCSLPLEVSSVPAAGFHRSSSGAAGVATAGITANRRGTAATFALARAGPAAHGGASDKLEPALCHEAPSAAAAAEAASRSACASRSRRRFSVFQLGAMLHAAGVRCNNALGDQEQQKLTQGIFI